jgi:hypothetical protein
LIAALFAAWRNFFEYSSWRNLDWLMVATEGDGDEGNDGNVRGQRRMNVCVCNDTNRQWVHVRC